MKLPVKPKDVRDIIDDDDAFICFANTKEDRDKIIIAINSHEKLVDALNNYGNHNPTCNYLSNLKGGVIEECDCGFEQALKEAEMQ